MKLTRGSQIWIMFAILLVGIAVRWRMLNQSLWFDEMTTLVEYVLQPWHKVLAARAGEYVPNNHVLHTILVKLIYQLGSGDNPLPPNEALLRLPALLAGLAVPFALIWPFRRTDPGLSLALFCITMLHPWLVDFSVEARGYTLLLLFGILATHCLMHRPVAYAVFLTLAIYTVPLAVLLIPAHAIAAIVFDRAGFKKFAISAAVSLLFSAALYSLMWKGLVSYYSNPFAPSMNYREFLDALPRHALAGMRWPRNPDPIFRMKDPPSAAVFWALPVLTILFGSMFAWNRPRFRPLLLVLGITTLLGIVFPLVLHNTSEVRFVLWIMPWFCVASVCFMFAGQMLTASSVQSKLSRLAGTVGFVVLIAWQLMLGLTMLPNQPIREGMAQADRLVPANRPIMLLYLGARESIATYGSAAPHHDLLPGTDIHYMVASEKLAIQQTGHLPWVLVSFEQLASGRDSIDPGKNSIWIHLMLHYHLAAPRLPGRITDVAIYCPKQE